MATISSINFTNWNYAHYNSEHFKALISITAVPSEQDEASMLYSPTVVDHEGVETFQCDFESLSEAIEFINDRYGHWQFSDPTLGSGSGCGSCEAH